MKINEVWEELREKSHANIQSEKGILKRQTRSIINKYHRFLYTKLKKLKANHRRKQHSKKCKSKISAKGFYAQKYMVL